MADPRRRALLLLALLAAGCAARAERIKPLNAYLPGSELGSQRVVDVSTHGGRASTFFTVPHLGDDAWRTAIEDALRKAGVLRADGRYHLDAEIVNEHQSGGSLFDPDVGVTLRVHYTLTDPGNGGAVVWQDNIETASFVKKSEVYVGVERARYAIEEAASKNLDKLILHLLTVLKKRAANATG